MTFNVSARAGVVRVATIISKPINLRGMKLSVVFFMKSQIA